MPELSVIIPLYNKGPHIKRALQSVLDQTFQDFEIIVIDDGSTDDGASKVRSCTDPRVHLIQQENHGVSAARNRGIAESTTDTIAFLDADDEWNPEFLEHIRDLQKKFPEAGAYVTDYLVQEQEKSRKTGKKGIPEPPWEGLIPDYFKAAALGEQPIISSAVAVPKRVLDEMAGFQMGVTYAEDADLWGRIALKYPIAMTWYCGAIYHTEAMNSALEKEIPLEKFPFEKLAEKIQADDPAALNRYGSLSEYLARHQIERANRHINAGYPKEARVILTNCRTDLLKGEKRWWTIWAYMPQIFFRIFRSGKRKIRNLHTIVLNTPFFINRRLK